VLEKSRAGLRSVWKYNVSIAFVFYVCNPVPFYTAGFNCAAGEINPLVDQEYLSLPKFAVNQYFVIQIKEIRKYSLY
jgi:hypothetical protein